MDDTTPELASEQSIVRRGAVAVIQRHGRLLVIRRSQHVIAPGKICFPGGGLEDGETEAQALVRELREELGCEVQPLKRLWEVVTAWRVHLVWWTAHLDCAQPICPNPQEVESIHWLTLEEIAAIPDLLAGNRQFVEAALRGEVRFD